MAPEDAKTAASGAAKTAGGILGVGGGADIAEGNGLDKFSAAASEAVGGLGGGLNRAVEVAGGVLREIFGGLPWNLSGGEVSGAASGMITVTTDIAASLL